jgi:hypothetical protein
MLVDIDVFGDYCVIKSDLSPYYEEEIYLIDEDDVKDTGNYNSAGLQTMVFFNKSKFRHNFMLGIIVVFFSLFPFVMLIRDGFNLIHIMFIIVLLYVCYVFFKNSISYYYKWQTALKGVDQETSEFRCYEGSSDEDGVLFKKTFQFNANPDAIPMWGIQKVTNVNVVPGKRSVLSPISLLRAMAKIEVIMEAKNSNNEFYTFSSVQLNNYNSTGYTLPNGWNTAVATESMYIDGEYRTFRPYTSKQNSTSFTRVTDKKYVVYVPEYDNLGGNATPSTITVNIDGKEYPIYFKDYSSTDGDNNPDYDIERNHIYR